MDKEEAERYIKILGENLYNSYSILREGNLSKKEINELTSQLIESEVEKCKDYLEYLSRDEIKQALLEGLRSTIKNLGKEMEF